MKLSVIIVHRNLKYHLEQCLHSLYRAIENIQAEVLIVDHASDDDSQRYITQRFPRLTYVCNPQDAGVIPPANQVMGQTTGEYILVLHPATVIGETTLTRAVDFMDAHPATGGAGVKVMASNGRLLSETVSKRVFMLLRRQAIDSYGRLTEGYEHSCLPVQILHYKGAGEDKVSAQPGKKLYQAVSLFLRKLRRQTGEPRFLVFAGEKSVHSIRSLCKRNKLNGRHHFVIAHERSTAHGHASSFVPSGAFTHVVYDSEAFSFDRMIELLSRHRQKELHLGIYSRVSRVLVTPETYYL
ncbi:MAG: glycosyltransferase [Bacteroides sp.]|uniref:glycosyltransferase n=1 Tax=Bacteroides sp. TaxID=29523 RepID=UPI002FC8D716